MQRTCAQQKLLDQPLAATKVEKWKKHVPKFVSEARDSLDCFAHVPKPYDLMGL